MGYGSLAVVLRLVSMKVFFVVGGEGIDMNGFLLERG